MCHRGWQYLGCKRGDESRSGPQVETPRKQIYSFTMHEGTAISCQDIIITFNIAINYTGEPQMATQSHVTEDTLFAPNVEAEWRCWAREGRQQRVNEFPSNPTQM